MQGGQIGDGWVLQGLKGGKFPFLLLLFFFFLKALLKHKRTRFSAGKIHILPFKRCFISIRQKKTKFAVIVPTGTGVLVMQSHPSRLGWCHPSALQHGAEDVCTRCSLLMTVSLFLMTLSSFSLSGPCNNESFESGNILGCVRQCKYKWKCASVYFDRDHLLWRCLLLASVSLYTGSCFVSLLCSDVRTSESELLGSPFLKWLGGRLARKCLLLLWGITGVKDRLNEWNLVLKLRKIFLALLPARPFLSLQSSQSPLPGSFQNLQLAASYVHIPTAPSAWATAQYSAVCTGALALNAPWSCSADAKKHLGSRDRDASWKNFLVTTNWGSPSVTGELDGALHWHKLIWWWKDQGPPLPCSDPGHPAGCRISKNLCDFSEMLCLMPTA